MKFSIISSSYNQLDQLRVLQRALEAQTYKDFEWIIADDGSSDKTLETFGIKNVDNSKIPFPYKYVNQEDKGYRLVEILNKAAVVAQGDYLVWIMGDSFPREDFLGQLSRHAAPDRMLTGIRLNVDNEGKIIGQDWRIGRVLFDIEQDLVQVIMPKPWEVMTLNSMVMPRLAYQQMGGIYPGYKGYGQMDWDMAAWAYYNGMKLYWAPKAVIYHRDHPEKEDTPENIALFEKRLTEFQGATLAHDARIKAKVDYIMDPKRADQKKEEMLKRAKEAERILDMEADEE